jgi:hypothetical protein
MGNLTLQKGPYDFLNLCISPWGISFLLLLCSSSLSLLSSPGVSSSGGASSRELFSYPPPLARLQAAVGGVKGRSCPGRRRSALLRRGWGVGAGCATRASSARGAAGAGRAQARAKVAAAAGRRGSGNAMQAEPRRRRRQSRALERSGGWRWRLAARRRSYGSAQAEPRCGHRRTARERLGGGASTRALAAARLVRQRAERAGGARAGGSSASGGHNRAGAGRPGVDPARHRRRWAARAMAALAQKLEQSARWNRNRCRASRSGCGTARFDSATACAGASSAGRWRACADAGPAARSGTVCASLSAELAVRERAGTRMRRCRRGCRRWRRSGAQGTRCRGAVTQRGPARGKQWSRT